MPSEAIVPLAATTTVLLTRSRSPWYFSTQAYAQESAFAHELAKRGRAFAVTDKPDELFKKSVSWSMPDRLVAPRLWDYSRQVRQFAAGLERQGNQIFCSSRETEYWENKVHMHRKLAEIDARTPETRMLRETDWSSVSFDIEPVLIKDEHSAGSAGIRYFSTAREARDFVSQYTFRPTETLIMQELVEGASRDLRITMVDDQPIRSASYWRIKSNEALASPEWTTTATSYNSIVDHGNIPDSAVAVAAKTLRALGVRMAGFDLMWAKDDISQEPLILEFSPYYQPNPPKPARYSHLSYKEFKKDKRFASDGYLASQFEAFRDIAAEILDQGLF